MTSIAPDAQDRKIVVGVDTHKYANVAVALDQLGTRIGDRHVPANREDYAQLEAWAALGWVSAFGIEGTGSYGVGLASFLRRSGHRIVAVNRGDRRSRRNNGKTDTLDAEAAAPRGAQRRSGRGAEVRRRNRRDERPTQDRPRHRPRGPHRGDRDAQGAACHHTRRPARDLRRLLRQGAD